MVITARSVTAARREPRPPVQAHSAYHAPQAIRASNTTTRARGLRRSRRDPDTFGAADPPEDRRWCWTAAMIRLASKRPIPRWRAVAKRARRWVWRRIGP